MGSLWRVRYTKLGFEVGIKTLPDGFAQVLATFGFSVNIEPTETVAQTLIDANHFVL